MARRMPQASSSLKALTITRPRQGRTRHMLGRERPPLYAPCLDRSERSSPLLHPPSKQDLPASVPALVGADQHHLSGLGLPTTLPEGSIKAGPYSSLMARMLDSGTGSLRMSGWPARLVNGLCFRPLREFLLSLAMADKGKTRSLARPGLRSLWLNCQFIEMPQGNI